MNGTRLDLRAVDGVVIASGQIDAHTAPRLADALCAARNDGPRTVLDLTEVTFCDSSGLGVLVAACPLVLRHPTPSVLRLLELTCTTTLFEFDEA